MIARRLLAFIRLSRLHFLPLSVLTHAIGLAWVEHEGGALDHATLGYGLAIQLLVQLSAAYLNDYWDRPTDLINTQRTLLSGGSGELNTGLLPPWIALAAAALCQGGALLVALAAGLPLLSWLMLFGVMGIAVFYTAPPLKLAWRGWGELATATVAAILVPQWAYSLQTGSGSLDLLAVQLPLLPLIMSLFVIIAAPDREADARVGKHTLPVLLGPARVALLYAGLVAAASLMGIVVWPAGVLPAILLGLPLAAWTGLGIRRHQPAPRAYLLLIVRAGMVPLLAILALNVALRAA